MTDRERRLARALTRLAVAAECLDRASIDIEAASPALGARCDRLMRSVRWLAREAAKELERGEVADG